MSRKVERRKKAVKETVRDLRHLNLGALAHRFRDYLAAKKRHRQALHEFQRERETKRERHDAVSERLDRLEADPVANEQEIKATTERLEELEHGIHVADTRAELQHTAISRIVQALRERIRPELGHRKRRRRVLTKRLRHRRHLLRKAIRAENRRDVPPGLGYFDGVLVASNLIPILQHARANGWGGTVNNGYRSPELSESICYSMCGAPTCPGRCAGRGSAHSQTDERACVDVSDPDGFARAQNELINILAPADPWHFSRTGH